MSCFGFGLCPVFVDAGGEADEVTGSPGDDEITVGNGADEVNGGAGVDTVRIALTGAGSITLQDDSFTQDDSSKTEGKTAFSLFVGK